MAAITRGAERDRVDGGARPASCDDPPQWQLDGLAADKRRAAHHRACGQGPLTIIAVLTGGVLLGVIGAIVAIPIAAAVRLLVEEVLLPRLNLA